ncbi:MAG: hypothetical protein ACR2IF_13885 [Terriglobales bacterium]
MTRPRESAEKKKEDRPSEKRLEELRKLRQETAEKIRLLLTDLESAERDFEAITKELQGTVGTPGRDRKH